MKFFGRQKHIKCNDASSHLDVDPNDTHDAIAMKTEKGLLSKKELLEIFVNHRVDSPFPGDWESIFKGSGLEFWGLRELAPFDSFKDIDWKATAKTGKYYVKEYLAESYFNLMILYDISNSVSFGRKELLQANIAVSLAYTAIAGNNGCGLILFADDVDMYIPARMGWSHFFQIVSAIATARPKPCRHTGLNFALRKLMTELPESLTFILSDFLYPVAFEYDFQRTTHGTSKHDVKAFQVLEDFELNLPPNSKGLISFRDYETGKEMLIDLGKWASYNHAMARTHDEIENHLRKIGINMLTITPRDNYALRINEFMKHQH